MSRLDDWLAYIKDPSMFDEHHFEPLITDTDEPVDYELAFGSLPNGTELIRRIRQVQQENAFTGLYYIPESGNKLSRPAMEGLARLYADALALRLSSMGSKDLVRLALENPFHFIARSEYEQRKAERTLAQSSIKMDIGDDYIDYLGKRPEYVWGLYEAVHFMTKYQEVTRYVLNAMVEYPINEQHAYDLWRGGAFITIGQQQTYIVILDE